MQVNVAQYEQPVMENPFLMGTPLADDDIPAIDGITSQASGVVERQRRFPNPGYTAIRTAFRINHSLCSNRKIWSVRESVFLLSLVLLLWLNGAGAQPFAGIQQPESPLSFIDIPLRLSLEPLINAADRMLPYQAGNWHTWKDWHGIDSQYRGWRGPLSITASGDVLLVQAHIRYWIRAQKNLLGAITLKASCGIDEAPRQAVIGMQVLLEWGPDWTLRPRFRILPTRFLDRCEMTIANIDVTPVVETEFRKQMQDSLRAALKTLAPGVNAIQRQAQQTWSLLQEPVELGQDNWLLLRPASVALSRIDGGEKYLDAHLALTLQPVLVTGAEPAGKPVPLPPLGHYYPRSAELNLHLSVNLDFPTLNQRLSDTLADKSFVIKGQKTGIKKFDLGGSGQEIRARMELTGDLTGTAELRASVAYDAQHQELELQDLTYDYDAEDSTVGMLAEAFHEPIRQALEDAANQALAQHLDLLGERLGTVLKKITPAGVVLDLSALQLSSVQILIEQQGIRLGGTATGSARLVLR
ncbi:MAG: DUF4403 family protein [Gammaproteobacteria bacterium]